MNVCMNVCMYKSFYVSLFVPVYAWLYSACCFYMLCKCSKFVVIVFIKTKIKAWLKIIIKRAGYLACLLFFRCMVAWYYLI